MSLTYRLPGVDGYDGGLLPLKRYVDFVGQFAAREKGGALDGRLREVLTGVPHDDAARDRVIATVVPPIRRYWIDVIALLRARADDPDAIGARIDARTEAVARDLDPIPPGIENAPRLIARIREQDDLYREWLATAGVGP